MHPMKSESTDRQVLLRRLLSSDQAIYAALYTDAQSMAFIGEPLSIAQAEKSLHAALTKNAATVPGLGVLVAEDAASGEALGVCGATLSVPRLGSVEVGVMLLAKKRGMRWSQVVMAELVRSIFDQHNIDQVWLKYDLHHEAVARYTSRLGFQVVDVGLFEGRWCRAAQLSREAWSKTMVSSHGEW